jgi:hypothetical protein
VERPAAVEPVPPAAEVDQAAQVDPARRVERAALADRARQVERVVLAVAVRRGVKLEPAARVDPARRAAQADRDPLMQAAARAVAPFPTEERAHRMLARDRRSGAQRVARLRPPIKWAARWASSSRKIITATPSR